MSTKTLKGWLLEMADGESIEAVVVGEMDTYYETPFADYVPNVVMTMEQADALLSMRFDNDYGRVGCPPVAAWTKTWIIGVFCYDGSTHPYRMPRDPCDHAPVMPGY